MNITMNILIDMSDKAIAIRVWRFLMLLQEEREMIVEYGKKMSSSGLCPGTSGNLSIYDAELDLMAISPSGIDYFETQPEDVVVTDLDAHIVEGTRKPSSEWALHTIFYKNKADVRAIVHTHSVYCTALGILGEPIRAIHYIIGEANTFEVPVAPYVTFGTRELAQTAIKTCKDSNALLLANHGIVLCARDLPSAFGLAQDMEYLARLQCLTMSIGKPNILTDEQMRLVIDRFKSYGQSRDDKN